jgi:molybdopterin-binding protein
MKAGVRNKFSGQIIEIKKGTIMAEVIIKAGDIEITSIMTMDSLNENDFKVGDSATALVKAINVVVVK